MRVSFESPGRSKRRGVKGGGEEEWEMEQRKREN